MAETILIISLVLNATLVLIIWMSYQFVVGKYTTFFERTGKVFNAHASKLDEQPKDTWDVVNYLDKELRHHKELCRKHFDEGDTK